MPSERPPRLDLLPVADMDDAQRKVHDAIVNGPRRTQQGTVPITDADGRLLGPFAVMLLTPEVGGPLQEVGAALRFATRLADRERELATLAVAAAYGCDFEWHSHEAAARKLGVTSGQLDSIAQGHVPSGLGDTEALVLRLAAAMARDRSLPDEDYDVAVELLGRAKLAEVTWLAGYYGALALALAVFRPAGGAPFSESGV
jgi:4-carboxymuconolactone decarboxylase